MTDMELLSERLERLEKRFRTTRAVAIIACIVIAAGVMMGQAPPPTVEAEVRSQHFVLVDGKGKERASLVADAAGSVFLVLFDANGKTRANLSASNDGPSLIFYDAAGQARTIVGSTTMVASHVNENGIAERAPASSIVLLDRAGKLLWREP